MLESQPLISLDQAGRLENAADRPTQWVAQSIQGRPTCALCRRNVRVLDSCDLSSLPTGGGGVVSSVPGGQDPVLCRLGVTGMLV